MTTPPSALENATIASWIGRRPAPAFHSTYWPSLGKAAENSPGVIWAGKSALVGERGDLPINARFVISVAYRLRNHEACIYARSGSAAVSEMAVASQKTSVRLNARAPLVCGLRLRPGADRGHTIVRLLLCCAIVTS